MLLLLNPDAAYGTARQTWSFLSDEVRERLDRPVRVVETSSPDAFLESVRSAVREGETEFLAGGGDGSVNMLLTTLMDEAGDTSRFTIGAIGLGTSNDFHKPFSDERRINGIPVRLDFEDARPVDVIRVTCHAGSETPLTRYCLCNASIGITAEANALYTSRPLLIRAIKWFSVNAAITAVALRTLFSWRDRPLTIGNGSGESETVRVTNLGIIKNPHFAGSFRYDTPVEPDDGRLIANLSHDLALPRRIALLARLMQGRFLGSPNTRSNEVSVLHVSAEEPFSVEMDGELETTTSVRFDLIPGAIRCCR